MTDVQGRTAFITGGANGIGLGIARALASAGVKLALVDVDGGALDRAKAELVQLTEVETAMLDVRDRDRFAELADQFEAKLGPISLLFNNAGVAGAAPAAKMTYELWDWGLGINLIGVVNGIQTFLPRIIERGQGGHIVNTASGAGLAASGAGALYHTAKFAVVGLSEALNAELGSKGVGVTVLCPGPVATGIIGRTRELQPDFEQSDAERKARKDASVQTAAWLEAGVTPDDVGKMVLDGIRNDRIYVHTDRIMEEAIKNRCKALLDAMPS